MSLLDKLHIEKSGYRLAVSNITSQIQEENGLFGRDRKEILQDAKEAVSSHEWFDGFNGAIYGEIVTYTDAEPAAIYNYEIESDPQDVLEVMAKECMVCDVMKQVDEVSEVDV